MIINFYQIMFGADPEFFFKENGKVIGAEKVLPKEGVLKMVRRAKLNEEGNAYVFDKEGDYIYETVPESDHKYVIIDGVQAEFNVVPNHCRQVFSHNLRLCFQKLDEQIHGKGITASFAQTVEVSKDEMQSLSKEAQQFGCAPSKNAYGRTKVAVTDASKYLSRSAGGHVHIGTYGNIDLMKKVLKNTDLTVPILDIVVGNTMVLLDRDPGNIERRKNYGRAGEFRLPTHGLEYRTLSNFWLRGYALQSFVLGMVRFAVNIAADAEASRQLLALVNTDDIAKAINENDAELAQANFDKVKDFLSGISPTVDSYPLQGSRLGNFEYFVSKGLDYWFKQDVMKHWLTHDYHANFGWENFVDLTVDKERAGLLQTATSKAKVFISGFSSM